LADSLGPHGIRLTTLEITFPRPYLAEFNTHRMLSRNSESSRAIPTEKQIERVKQNPYIPEFRERVKGMGGGQPLKGAARTRAQGAWLDARDAAVEAATALLKVAKDDANRVLEPFVWHTAIVSATDWDNFFNLRDHEAAALPMQRIARLMKEAMWASTPRHVGYGEWHLPLVDPFEADLANLWSDFGATVSAGRCARSSYSNHMDPESPNDSHARWEKLSQAGHWSPGEHPAECVPEDTENLGNFRGWQQLRKHYVGEDVFHG
jgi:hypothetical protein